MLIPAKEKKKNFKKPVMAMILAIAISVTALGAYALLIGTSGNFINNFFIGLNSGAKLMFFDDDETTPAEETRVLKWDENTSTLGSPYSDIASKHTGQVLKGWKIGNNIYKTTDTVKPSLLGLTEKSRGSVKAYAVWAKAVKLKVGDKINFGTFSDTAGDIIGQVASVPSGGSDYYEVQLYDLTKGVYPGDYCGVPEKGIADDYDDKTSEFIKRFGRLLKPGTHLYLPTYNDSVTLKTVRAMAHANTNLPFKILHYADKGEEEAWCYEKGLDGTASAASAGAPFDSAGNVWPKGVSDANVGGVQSSNPRTRSYSVSPAFELSPSALEYFVRDDDTGMVMAIPDGGDDWKSIDSLSDGDVVTFKTFNTKSAYWLDVDGANSSSYYLGSSDNYKTAEIVTPTIKAKVIDNVGGDDGYYVIQTYGLTSGEYPYSFRRSSNSRVNMGSKQVDRYCDSMSEISDPYSGIDDYNETTKAFSKRYGKLFEKGTCLYLPTADMVKNGFELKNEDGSVPYFAASGGITYGNDTAKEAKVKSDAEKFVFSSDKFNKYYLSLHKGADATPLFGAQETYTSLADANQYYTPRINYTYKLGSYVNGGYPYARIYVSVQQVSGVSTQTSSNLIAPQFRMSKKAANKCLRKNSYGTIMLGDDIDELYVNDTSLSINEEVTHKVNFYDGDTYKAKTIPVAGDDGPVGLSNDANVYAGDTSVKIPSKVPEKKGYEFQGWSTDYLHKVPEKQSDHPDKTDITLNDVISFGSVSGVVCEIKKDGDGNPEYYVIQTKGMTSGEWPSGDYVASADVADPMWGIDTYNDITKTFAREYGALFAKDTHLYLPTKTYITGNNICMSVISSGSDVWSGSVYTYDKSKGTTAYASGTFAYMPGNKSWTTSRSMAAISPVFYLSADAVDYLKENDDGTYSVELEKTSPKVVYQPGDEVKLSDKNLDWHDEYLWSDDLPQSKHVKTGRKEVNLYAVWRKMPVAHFYDEDGVTKAADDRYISWKDGITLPDSVSVSKDGYSFDGWSEKTILKRSGNSPDSLKVGDTIDFGKFVSKNTDSYNVNGTVVGSDVVSGERYYIVQTDGLTSGAWPGTDAGDPYKGLEDTYDETIKEFVSKYSQFFIDGTHLYLAGSVDDQNKTAFTTAAQRNKTIFGNNMSGAWLPKAYNDYNGYYWSGSSSTSDSKSGIYTIAPAFYMSESVLKYLKSSSAGSTYEINREQVPETNTRKTYEKGASVSVRALGLSDSDLSVDCYVTYKSKGVRVKFYDSDGTTSVHEDVFLPWDGSSVKLPNADKNGYGFKGWSSIRGTVPERLKVGDIINFGDSIKGQVAEVVTSSDDSVDHYAIQTLGMTHGSHPGWRSLNDYDATTKKFVSDYGSMFTSGSYLHVITENYYHQHSAGYERALAKASENSSIFGGMAGCTWFGSYTGSNTNYYYDYFERTGEGTGKCYSVANEYTNNGIAPAFDMRGDAVNELIGASGIYDIRSELDQSHTASFEIGDSASVSDFGYTGSDSASVPEVKLYAGYKKTERATVHLLDSDGNSSVEDNLYLSWDGTKKKLPIPKKDKYKFDGWSVGGIFFGDSDTSDLIKGDVIDFGNYGYNGTDVKGQVVEKVNGTLDADTYYVIQLMGLTHGIWPGNGSIDDIDAVTRNFKNEYGSLFEKGSGMFLPTWDYVNKNCSDIFVSIADNAKSYGAQYTCAWLSDRVNCWNDGRGLNHDSRAADDTNYVIAPEFRLSASALKYLYKYDDVDNGYYHVKRYYSDFSDGVSVSNLGLVQGVKESVSLYARWQKLTVNFYDDDGTTALNDGITLSSDSSSFTVPEPSGDHSGYQFKGWRKASPLKAGNVINFGSNKGLVAEVKKDYYVIQTYGICAGAWPGSRADNVDDFTDDIAKFKATYASIMYPGSHMYVVNANIATSGYYKTGYINAADNSHSFGGTAVASDAWTSDTHTVIYGSGSRSGQSMSDVADMTSTRTIAPAFKMRKDAVIYITQNGDATYTLDLSKADNLYQPGTEVTASDLGISDVASDSVDLYAVWVKTVNLHLLTKDGEQIGEDIEVPVDGSSVTIPSSLNGYDVSEFTRVNGTLKKGDRVRFGKFLTYKQDGSIPIWTPDITGEVTEVGDDYYVIQTYGMTAGAWPGGLGTSTVTAGKTQQGKLAKYTSDDGSDVSKVKDPSVGIPDRYDQTVYQFTKKYKKTLFADNTHMYLQDFGAGSEVGHILQKASSDYTYFDAANAYVWGGRNSGGPADAMGFNGSFTWLDRGSSAVVAPAFKIKKSAVKLMAEESDGCIHADYNLTTFRPGESVTVDSFITCDNQSFDINLYQIDEQSSAKKKMISSWTSEDDYYTPVFDSDGGTSVTQTFTNLTDTDMVTLPQAPVKPGYEFTGWKNGSSIFKSGDTVNVSDLKKDGTFIRITAQWKITETSTEKAAGEKNSIEKSDAKAETVFHVND